MVPPSPQQGETHMSKAKTLLTILVALGILFVGSAGAQIRSATITGTVTDQPGAVVANADVVVTNGGTNVAYKTKTTEAGQFTAPYLEAGTYTGDVRVPGFLPYRGGGG